MRKTYRNPNLTPKDERFQRTYSTVVAAVNKLGDQHEVEVTFRDWKDCQRWRRRAYEFMNITGIKFSVCQVGTATLRLTTAIHERPGPIPVAIDGILATVGESLEQPEAELSPEDEDHARDVARRIAGVDTKVEDDEVLDVLRGGSHGNEGSGGTEP